MAIGESPQLSETLVESSIKRPLWLMGELQQPMEKIRPQLLTERKLVEDCGPNSRRDSNLHSFCQLLASMPLSNRRHRAK